MISLHGLTKRYGEKTVVDDLSFDISEGRVTGFLGPNGSGKSTTMRMILGLDRPTSGRALIGGKAYGDLENPAREVGALLDAKAVHPGRSAYRHLVAMARAIGSPVSRVDEVLDRVGLAPVARQRAGSFSLGMGQRLGIAGALLGDPGILIFDEPVNGLDPDGVLWIRRLMRSLAAEGRTVLVSSHLMSEMQETADQLVIIGKGRLVADAPIADVIEASSQNAVKVASPDAAELRRQLSLAGMRVEAVTAEEFLVTGAGTAQIGRIAKQCGAELHELSPQAASLEQAYMELTAASVEYAAPAPHGEKEQA